ncbi:hypothetical protein [Amycolatopsis panacis]|uniref:Uncharacterized protein n=1 Tax=Amycolatopsis panacis TaxID=2340917 RepID=A0A419HQX1_9PSEU|nr:hypothetical protein [Amycolatopsis panacis]RJQ78902.1 hypothetical protein D5S19_27055 [Amycolatopsis panacis]
MNLILGGIAGVAESVLLWLEIFELIEHLNDDLKTVVHGVLTLLGLLALAGAVFTVNRRLWPARLLLPAAWAQAVLAILGANGIFGASRRDAFGYLVVPAVAAAVIGIVLWVPKVGELVQPPLTWAGGGPGWVAGNQAGHAWGAPHSGFGAAPGYPLSPGPVPSPGLVPQAGPDAQQVPGYPVPPQVQPGYGAAPQPAYPAPHGAQPGSFGWPQPGYPVVQDGPPGHFVPPPGYPAPPPGSVPPAGFPSPGPYGQYPPQPGHPQPGDPGRPAR